MGKIRFKKKIYIFKKKIGMEKLRKIINYYKNGSRESKNKFVKMVYAEVIG